MVGELSAGSSCEGTECLEPISGVDSIFLSPAEPISNPPTRKVLCGRSPQKGVTTKQFLHHDKTPGEHPFVDLS